MKSLENAVLEIISNLRFNKKLEGVRISDSYSTNSGIVISEAEESKLKDYISDLKKACFYNINSAKDSWHQLNGLFKPIINAGIIELCKYLPYLPGFDKNVIYRSLGIKIGKNTTIAPRVQFDYFHPELIEIGDNCLLGDNVKIWTHDYSINSFAIGNVKIGDNVKVGSESVIFPCTEIGNNCKINFRSFLYNVKIPPYSKVFGKEKSENYPMK